MAVFTGNGSQASPSLTFSSDTNTGIFRPGVDQLGLVTDGATRLFINATGQVGLGITTLSEQLTLAASGVTQNVALMLLGTNTNSGQSNGVKLKAIGSADDSGRGNLAFETRRTNLNYEEAMRLTSDGRLGIGTTSPGAPLTVVEQGVPSAPLLRFIGHPDNGNYMRTGWVASDNTTSLASLNVDGSDILNFGTSGSTPLSLRTNNTERARIDSSGRLLVGTSSTSQTCTLLVQGNSAASTSSGTIKLARGISNPSDGFSLGDIDFGDSGHVASATIGAKRDGGTWTSGSSQPSRLVFSTTADGASSPTERMRITNGGAVGIGATSLPSGTNAIWLDQADGATRFSRDSTDGRFQISFYNPNGLVGTIQTSGSSTAYNTSSDYRLKENVVPLTGAANRLNQLQVHRFNFIADPDTTVDGFIAHEAAEVVPECVTGTKDKVDADGNPIYQGIDQSKLVPLLTAALQEVIAEIESLKARLDAASL
jgi:hypothetical protein